MSENLVVEVLNTDKRNRLLFKKIEKLRQSVKEKLCRYTIGDTIFFIEEYMAGRFFEEEKYMLCCGYPSFPFHKSEHERFVVELFLLKEELHGIMSTRAKGSYELSIKTIQAVTDWIDGHVQNDDKEFCRFLARQRTYKQVWSNGNSFLINL